MFLCPLFCGFAACTVQLEEPMLLGCVGGLGGVLGLPGV